MEPTATFNLVWVAGLVGFFLPLVTSFIKRTNWSTQAKRILALVISGVAGIVTVGVQAGWEFNSDFLQSAILGVTDIYVVAAVTYQNFWKDTAIEKGLESVGSPKAPRFDENYNVGEPGYKG